MNSEYFVGSYRSRFINCLFLSLFLPGIILGIYIGASADCVYSSVPSFRGSVAFRIAYLALPFAVLPVFSRYTFFKLFFRCLCFFRATSLGFVFYSVFSCFGIFKASECVFADLLLCFLMCELFDRFVGYDSNAAGFQKIFLIAVSFFVFSVLLVLIICL